MKGIQVEVDGRSVALDLAWTQQGSINIPIVTVVAGSRDYGGSRLLLKTASGDLLCEKTIPVKVRRRPTNSAAADYDVSPLLDNSGYLRVWGPFDGDLAKTRIEIGGQPAIPLTESSGELVAEIPDDSLGLLNVKIISGKVTIEKLVRFVGLELRIPSERETRSDPSLRRSVFVRVLGLKNLAEAVDLEFENSWYWEMWNTRVKNPFSGRKNLRWEQRRIEPKDVRPDGTYSGLFRPKHGKIDHLGVSIYPVLAPLRVRGVVAESIEEWSTESAIAITSEAQALIAQGFEEKESLLKEVLAGPRTYDTPPNVLLAGVVRQYLYELRDGIRASTARASPLVLRFWGDGEERGRDTIETLHILRHTVADYLRTIVSRLSGDVVSCQIQSKPQSLHVFLDGEYKGLTNTEFMLSAGKYTVVIKPARGKPLCTKKIEIVPGPPAELHCPEEN